MNNTHTHRHVRRHSAISLREVLLVLLVALLGGVTLYVSNDSNTAFGLLNQPVYADFVPVRITFRTDTLLSQPFLELNVVDRNKSATQVSGDDFDTSNPPAVTNVSAFNTRVGGEVMVYWTFPDHVTTVNVYRKNPTGKEEKIATNVTDNFYRDTNVENTVVYTYRVVSTVVDGDSVIESTADASEVTAVPTDTIAPQAPTDISVLQIDSAGGKGLHITWVNPTEEDVESIVVYRSVQYGTRGEQVATIPVTDPSEYNDTDAPTNTTVYYTVVAVDAAGNASSDDFQMPLPGNDSPFTPIGLTNESD